MLHQLMRDKYFERRAPRACVGFMAFPAEPLQKRSTTPSVRARAGRLPFVCRFLNCCARLAAAQGQWVHRLSPVL